MKKFFQIAGFPIRLPVFSAIAFVGLLISLIEPGFLDKSDWTDLFHFLTRGV